MTFPAKTRSPGGSGQASLTHLVTDFARETGFADLPPEVVRAARDHLLDGLGVGLAAASLAPAAGMRRAVASLGGGGESTGLGCPGKLPAPSAALLNGALMHSLEYDDTHIASVVHGSSVIVPAALAVAERTGASGADLLRAIVMGWELLVRLGLAAPGRFQAHGFQITSVGGPFAAALITALLEGLSAAQTVNAMGIAGSQSSGVFEYLSDGSTVKSMHPGWAAHSGVVAGYLAAGEMTGPATIFEGRFGLYATHARMDQPPEALRPLFEGLGREWMLPEASFKAYPCCHYIHPFLECLEKILAGGVRPEEIESIHCEVSAGMLPIICDPWERRLHPASGYEAKFSLPVCLAALLEDGAVSVDTFATDALPAGILATAGKISFSPLEDTDFPQSFPARLEVRRYSASPASPASHGVPNVRGAPDRPLTSEEVRGKFQANAARILRSKAVERIPQLVEELPLAPDLSQLGEALRELA